MVDRVLLCLGCVDFYINPMKHSTCYVILLLALASCGPQQDRAHDQHEQSSPGSVYVGTVPLFGVPLVLSNEGEEIDSVMKRFGATSTHAVTWENIGDSVTAVVCDLPSSPLLTGFGIQGGVVFEGGKIGSNDMKETKWNVVNGRIVACYADFKSDETDTGKIFSDYRNLYRFISDKLGKPVWRSAFNSDSYGYPLEGVDIPFIAYFTSYYWEAEMKPAYIAAKDDGRGWEEYPALDVWQWSDKGVDWAVICGIEVDSVLNLTGENIPHYGIKLTIFSNPNIDLHTADSDLAAREKEYVGWYAVGGDANPVDYFLPCDAVADSTYQILKSSPDHAFLEVHSMLRETSWVVQRNWLGLYKIYYAFDTSRTSYGSLSTENMFIRCKGIYCETPKGSKSKPLLYITKILDVRLSEEADCP